MKLTVNLEKDSYPIYIENNILSQAGDYIRKIYHGKRIMIISDDNVFPLYGDRLIHTLDSTYECHHLVLPHGESTKDFQTLPTVYKAMLEAKISRSDLVIALGGGVIGDLAGFAASSYLRGVRLLQIPTSLLAQVDSSVGGKVAVDLPEGKNLVGAFYQPSLVLIDPLVLNTLKERFISDGMGEVIKYGCIKDDKFYDRIKDCLLFKNLDGKYLTLQDFVAENKKEDTAEAVKETESTENAEEKQKEKTVLFYVTDEVQQSQYINLFKEQGIDAVILKHNIDSAFITHLERQDDTIKFERIDADVNADMKEEVSEEDLKEEKETLTDVFHKALNNDKLEVKVEKLKNASVSSMIVLSEETRRMQDMMKMYNMYGMDPNMFGGQETLVLNANHQLVKYLAENQESDKAPLICEQLYDLAMMSHKQLSPDEMTRFVQRSNDIMMLLTK